MAYVAGSFLLLLVAEMVLKYSPTHVEIFMGGDGGLLHLAPVIVEPQCHWYSMFVPNGLGCEIHTTGTGINISLMILIVHGWIYVVYLFACFRLWQMLRWPVMRLIWMALGGVVPLLSFFVESRMKKVAADDIQRLEKRREARDRKRKQAAEAATGKESQ